MANRQGLIQTDLISFVSSTIDQLCDHGQVTQPLCVLVSYLKNRDNDKMLNSQGCCTWNMVNIQ